MLVPKVPVLGHVIAQGIGEELPPREEAGRPIAALAAALNAAGALAALRRHPQHIGQTPQGIVGVGNSGEKGFRTAPGHGAPSAIMG